MVAERADRQGGVAGAGQGAVGHQVGVGDDPQPPPSRQAGRGVGEPVLAHGEAAGGARILVDGHRAPGAGERLGGHGVVVPAVRGQDAGGGGALRDHPGGQAVEVLVERADDGDVGARAGQGGALVVGQQADVDHRHGGARARGGGLGHRVGAPHAQALVAQELGQGLRPVALRVVDRVGDLRCRRLHEAGGERDDGEGGGDDEERAPAPQARADRLADDLGAGPGPLRAGGALFPCRGAHARLPANAAASALCAPAAPARSIRAASTRRARSRIHASCSAVETTSP